MRAHKMIRATHGLFFLEIFSGTGRLSKALNRHGISTKSFDSKHGSHEDLLRIEVLHHIRKLIRSGRCLGVWFGLPCGTFSRARRFGGKGPGPLRGDTPATLWGLPGLQGKDLARVKSANRLVRRTCVLCKLCKQCGVSFYIENPLTSRIWLLKPIQELCSFPHSQLSRYDYCQFGTPWRKATRILAYHNPLFAQNAQQCHFGKDYTCCRTHRRHVQLTGTGEGGKHLTAIAEPYPRKLCNKWAYIILQNQISDHIIQNMKLLTDE